MNKRDVILKMISVHETDNSKAESYNMLSKRRRSQCRNIDVRKQMEKRAMDERYGLILAHTRR